MFELFDFYESQADKLVGLNLPLPAANGIKRHYAFNLLDARGAFQSLDRASALGFTCITLARR